LLVSCSAPIQTNTPSPTTDPFNTSWDDRSIYKSGLVESAQPLLDDLKGASVYHIEFDINSDLYHVAGRQQVRYTNTETVPLNEVEFRLFPNILGGKMEVTDLRVDGEAVTPGYELKDSLMVVPISSPHAPGQSIVIGMDFAVTVPQTVERNYGVLASYEDVLALAHA
jgi:hypothetical protein